MHPHRAIYKTNPFQKSAAQLPTSQSDSIDAARWPVYRMADLGLGGDREQPREQQLHAAHPPSLFRLR